MAHINVWHRQAEAPTVVEIKSTVPSMREIMDEEIARELEQSENGAISSPQDIVLPSTTNYGMFS